MVHSRQLVLYFLSFKILIGRNMFNDVMMRIELHTCGAGSTTLATITALLYVELYRLVYKQCQNQKSK